MFPSMEDCCLEAFGRRQACYWLNECNSVIEAVADNIVEEASGLVAFNGFGSAKSGKSGSNYCYSDCDCYDWQFCNFFSGSSSSTGSSSGKSGKGKSGKSEGYCQSCNQKLARVVVFTIVHPPQGLPFVSHRSLIRATITLMTTTIIMTTTSALSAAEVVTVTIRRYHDLI